MVGAADLAAGGANQNVLGFMRGVVLESDIIAWRHESPAYSAARIREACLQRAIASLYYDAGGGYGGAVADMARDSGQPLPFRVRALHAGAPASALSWPEKGDNGRPLTSRDKFRNARAEWWWLLRERFRKTWEVVENGRAYPAAELISIPNHADLITDLSKPLIVPNIERLIALESKKDMAARGVASPDFGDMLAMLMAPPSADEALDSLRDRMKERAQ
jgi:phage terminase large subunit